MVSFEEIIAVHRSGLAQVGEAEKALEGKMSDLTLALQEATIRSFLALSWVYFEMNSSLGNTALTEMQEITKALKHA